MNTDTNPSNAFLQHPLLRQVAAFLCVGVVCLIVEVSCFRLFRIELSVMAASMSATMVSVLLNYYLSLRFVFEPGRFNKPAEFSAFVAQAAVLIGLNQLFFWIALKLAPTHEVLCKIAAIGAIAVFGFLMKKYWVFLR